jgi:hypothetical protein
MCADVGQARPCLMYCPCHPPAQPPGNLLRNGDVRGYNSMAKMYTYEFAREGEGGGATA